MHDKQVPGQRRPDKSVRSPGAEVTIELQLGISLPVQVLRTELISRRAANAVNCRAISPVPNGFYIKGWSESQRGFIVLKTIRKVKILLM